MRLERCQPLQVGRLLAALLWLSGCTHSNTDVLSDSNSVRWVTLPSQLAVLSASTRTNGLPGELHFGGPLGRSALYLKFPNLPDPGAALQKAFIVLSPREDAVSDATPVSVEAWRVNSDWQPEALHQWSEKPSLAPPYSRTELSNAPPTELRIDVSELLRFAAQNPELDFGIALLGRPSSGHGSTFATGMNGGSAPRLEVYQKNSAPLSTKDWRAVHDSTAASPGPANAPPRRPPHPTLP